MKLSFRFPGDKKKLNSTKEWLGKTFGKRISWKERMSLSWTPQSPIEYLLLITVEDEDVEAQLLIVLKLGDMQCS